MVLTWLYEYRKYGKRACCCEALTEDIYLRAKKLGFLDKTIEQMSGKQIGDLKRLPVYKTVDTCAAEFDAETPYYYSTFDDETEVKPSDGRKKVLFSVLDLFVLVKVSNLTTVLFTLYGHSRNWVGNSYHK